MLDSAVISCSDRTFAEAGCGALSKPMKRAIGSHAARRFVGPAASTPSRNAAAASAVVRQPVVRIWLAAIVASAMPCAVPCSLVNPGLGSAGRRERTRLGGGEFGAVQVH